MFVRKLRQRSRLSQEQLAESAGLSLRTVQRVEAGHRISYASLRAIAAVFEMDVDQLELELYAVDKTAREYRELPLWVRLILGRGWTAGSRHDLFICEVFLAGGGLLLALIALSGQFWPIADRLADAAPRMSLLMFACAWVVSLAIRVGDRYSAWPLLGVDENRSVFGIFRRGRDGEPAE